MAFPVPEGTTLEWATNPSYPREYQATITTALLQLGIGQQTIEWDSFVSMILDKKNAGLCRGKFQTNIFLESNHNRDILVIVRKDDLLLGILALNFYSPSANNVNRNLSELYVSQICVRSEEKGLGPKLMKLAESIAKHLGSSAIKLIVGTASWHPERGRRGMPKLLEWYLNQGYNWDNQRYKPLNYPTLVKPLSNAAIADLASSKEEATILAAQRAAALQALLNTPAPPRLESPPPERAGAGGAPANARKSRKRRKNRRKTRRS